MRPNIFQLLLVAAVVAPAGTTIAEPWANASGTSTSGHFSWTNGRDDSGVFGSPIVTDDGRFIFNTGVLSADDTTANGLPVVINDTASWDLLLSPGFIVTGAEVRMIGALTVRGVNSYVDFQSFLEISELAGQPPEAPRTFTGSAHTTPINFPRFGSGVPQTANFSSVSTIDTSFIVPPLAADLHIRFHALLEAMKGGPTELDAANIEVHGQGQGFEIEIRLIPEPTSAALFAIGAMMLLRRRR